MMVIAADAGRRGGHRREHAVIIEISNIKYVSSFDFPTKLQHMDNATTSKYPPSPPSQPPVRLSPRHAPTLSSVSTPSPSLDSTISASSVSVSASSTSISDH